MSGQSIVLSLAQSCDLCLVALCVLNYLSFTRLPISAIFPELPPESREGDKYCEGSDGLTDSLGNL
ncbi:hypothetical protein BVC93_20470 [Mycobacterium sp. MS1601]|nr:hypothetical protein BVC93_20470 [Mycobacterium sp. MS1601]